MGNKTYFYEAMKNRAFITGNPISIYEAEQILLIQTNLQPISSRM